MNSTIRAQLSAIADVTVDEDTVLADLTTLRLGGRPLLTAYCATAEALTRTVATVDASGVPLLLVGGGSNLIVADGPLPLVAVVATHNDITLDDTHPSAPTVTAGAGAVWDDVVAATVEAGFGGLECLSGIPGSAGATPVQNVGAYGVEVSQVLDSVTLYDRATCSVHTVAPDELGLAYRTSVLKGTDRAVVLSVTYRLNGDGLSQPLRYGELARALEAEVGERLPAWEVREEVLRLRAGKGMVLNPRDHDTWSVGSFFTNPVVADIDAVKAHYARWSGKGDKELATMPAYPAPLPDGCGQGHKLSAAWLIEHAGYTKGYPRMLDHSPVALSTKHTLALTNLGGAETVDLLRLAEEIRSGVHEAFGVWLEAEAVLVGVEL